MAKRKTATRTISNAGRLRILTVVASHKAIGLAPTESAVEVDGLVDLEYDETVEQFQVQPQTFGLDVDGRPIRYTPDAKVLRHTGVIGYREFKHAGTPLEPMAAQKLEAAGTYLRRRGFDFDIVQSDELRIGYRMDNLHLLRRYARWPAPQKLRAKVFESLGARHRQTLGDLRSLVGNFDLGGLYRMLWDKQVGVDLVSERLSGRTPVWRLPS